MGYFNSLSTVTPEVCSAERALAKICVSGVGERMQAPALLNIQLGWVSQKYHKICHKTDLTYDNHKIYHLRFTKQS